MSKIYTLQSSFTSGILSPSLFARQDLDKYAQGCKTLLNMLIEPQGGAVKRAGFLYLAELESEVRLLAFKFSTRQSYVLLFGEKFFMVATDSGLITGSNNQPYRIASPYTLKQAKELSHAQSADIVYLTHSEVAPHKLIRKGPAEWVFEKMVFTSKIAAPVLKQPTITPSESDTYTSSYTYIITAVNADDRESPASNAVTIKAPASNNWTAGAYVSLKWQAVAGAVDYKIYKTVNGGRLGFIARVSGVETTDINIETLVSDTPPIYRDPFSDGSFPSTAGVFMQRLMFGGSPKRPQTLWFSKAGDFENFSKSSEVKSTDAIEFTIYSDEVSEILWAVPLRTLVIGTGGVEWEIASQEGVFGATSIGAKPQSYRGSKRLRSIVIGNVILHVSRSGMEVRDLRYDYSADSYGGSNRTILASHLFKGKQIVAWTYQDIPDGILWCVLGDGTLLGMTFQDEHNVYAWHEHKTNGTFVDVCSIPTNVDDSLFIVAKRSNRFFLELSAGRIVKDADAFIYSDCSSVYFEENAQGQLQKHGAIKGLERFEGREVVVVCDDAVHPARIVTSGQVVLDAPSYISVVGLLYEAELETLPIEVMLGTGSSVGKNRQISSIQVRFADTLLAQAGLSKENAQSVINTRRIEPYDTAQKVISGIFDINPSITGSNEVSVYVGSNKPTPLTVLSITADMAVRTS